MKWHQFHEYNYNAIFEIDFEHQTKTRQNAISKQAIFIAKTSTLEHMVERVSDDYHSSRKSKTAKMN